MNSARYSQMETDLEKLLQDESEDAILARIQEESLRYYNEVELPRRAADEIHQQEVVSLDAEKSTHSQPQPHCSKLNNNSQNTPVEDVFYKESGQGANGFHLAAGETYVYPTNYPIRKYQMNIIQSALFHNTLVSLPTGLGKTFIAAVVMFNYYRWFPQGKIVFMAPTRPLVAQQIRACHNIMAIPIKDTVEMTGTMNPADRLQQWKNKRVFFLTPQVMANDLRSGVCPATHFKCVVIDEAHRATKEYSYCHVIKELEKAGAMFRILALSATPGSNIKAVVEVAQNLRISTLELRGEDSPDVIPYTHSKLIEPVSLSLSKNILDFREQFLHIFERYARNLREARLVTCNVQNMTKFQLLKASERIRSKPPNGMTKARLGVLMSDFTVCMTLAHGLELLQTYGLRAFYQYFTGCEDEEKRKAAFTRLRQDVEFHQLMENLHNAISSPMDQFWSHPKHEHLVKILKEHFSRIENQENGSKVIIFCQYRVVVSEVYELLQKIHPSIKPVMFIGQGGGKDKSGLPQKKQIEIMRNFREGRSNVLIATCVAEEGLDIGSVDLLILMEVQRSPVRLVQRLGRTGRHRQGRCVVLLTNGKEVQKFHEAMATKNSFINMIQNSKLLSANLYKDEPIMVPPHLMPKIQLVHINVPERITPGKAKKQVDIRQALMTKLDETEAVTQSPFLLPEQEALVKEELNTLKVKFNSLSFMESKYIYPRINDAAMECEELFDPQFHQQCEFTDWNRVAQQTYLVSHSLDTEMLCHLLNKAESMQLGQHTDLNSQMDYNTIIGNKKKDQKIKVKPAVQNPIKKRKIEKEENHGMDIRECMAIAAEKVRLTQDKCGNKDDSVIISEPLTSPIILVSTCEPVIQNERERDQVDCTLCNHPFGGITSQLHKLKTSTKEFTFNFDFSKLKFYVNSLTKEAMTQFNGSYTLDKNIGFTVEGINKNIIALKETKQKSSNLFNANDIFDNEFQTPPRPLLPKENSRNQCLKKLDTLNGMVEKVSVKTSPNCQKPDYFDLEDIFAGDDELDIQYLEKYSKTSTPIKNKAPDFDMPLKFCENDTIKRYTQNHNKVENIKFNSCASPNRSANQAGSSSDSLFKIPQIKLNPQMLNTLHDISKGSDVQLSPQSPILSGQIMPHKNYLGPNSPQSPILSGQITLSSTKKKGIKTLYCESPDSPILSSQFFHINVSSANKLEPKILFSENKIKEQNSNITNSCWVQSLDNGLNKNHANIPQMEIEDDNMVLASQLFDDDSNEGNPKKNLDQSSMYTISQMVEKVNALSKNAMDHDSTILQSEKGTKISEEDCVKFGSSDEDSLFENINLDDFSVRKENNTIHINVSGSGKVLSDNTTNSADCKVVLQKHPLRRRSNETIQRNPHSEAAEDETIQLDDSKCKTSSIISTNKNLAPTNLGTLNKTCEESLITSRWLSCMKSPFQPHSIKTSTPLVSVKNTTNLDSGSDSNNDVFQSPLQKQKTKSPVNVGKPPRKEIKQQLFVEMEANVTGCYSSDEESTSGLDDLDESFINDMTEQPCTSADQTVLDMHARYLQSVKSPVRKPGGFKIPKVSDSALAQDVFSQYVEEDEEDLYLNDSFCCDATEFPVEEEPSVLEIAERILNEDRKTRKVKRKRKKFIRPISSNDDTDIDEEHKARRLLSSESSDEDKVGQTCKTVKRKQCFSFGSSSDEQSLKIKQPFKRKRTHLLTSDSDSDRTL